MSSAPLLMDVKIDGKPRKVVAVPSKQSWLYVFDRVTGQPIWPIVETPVPQSDVPGEKTSPDAADSDQAATIRAHLHREETIRSTTPRSFGPRGSRS